MKTGLPAERPNAEPLLQLVQISKRFGTLVALQDVSLQISCGEVVGPVGDMARQSTLLQLIGGLYPPTSGAMIRQRGCAPDGSAQALVSAFR
jgi:ABC-type sugar transport system ATPase subunit